MRRLHRKFVTSPNIGRVRMIKYRTLKWEGHVVRMGEGRRILEMLTDKPTEMRPS